MFSRIYVEITNICNMNCSFCHGHSRKFKQMTTEEFKEILNKISGFTNYIYYHLMGEPLTHPELPEFLEIASQKGFKSMITTNGTLLKQYGDKILDTGIHKVNISVHSFEDGTEEQFEDYMKNLVDFAIEANNQGVIVVFRLWNNGFDNGRNNKIIDYLKSNINEEWTPNSKGYKILDKMFLEYGERFSWPDLNEKKQGNDVFCYGLRDHIGILSDGTVVPCCLDSEGAINLGNIFDSSLNDILNSERAKAIKYGFDCRTAVEELCQKCGYAQRFKVR
ncbi:MAG: radical SAM/SPASM domain-containing protein [Acutalibacteraceae bacterium]|nr:radical SAM/SPASM domain-containing protein [Acutalibacteraceae bacterium]